MAQRSIDMERRTWSPKLADLNTGKRWYVVDAEGQTLGRIATVIASTLRGKTKPTYTPHADVGDFVIVVNAEKVVLTGKKETQKLYSHHSGYPGGLRQRSVREVRASHPERLIENAVRGMLPGNVLGRRQFRKLKVYAGPDHPHATQQPEVLLVERRTAAE
jgi:large subunit ribosomal protein L13